MNNQYLINLINELIKESNHNKDDGSYIINNLSYLFKKTNRIEKEFWVSFFLNEIEFNTYGNGFWSICLDTFVKANYTKVAPEIDRIFIEQQPNKNDFWKYRFTRALLKLELNSQSYIKYIDYLIEKEDGGGYILLIYLSKVNPNIAKIKLSEFYAKFLDNNFKVQKLITSLLDVLIEHISWDGSGYVIDLVQMTYKKNKSAGLFLKAKFIEFLKSNSEYNNKFVQDIMKGLLSIP